MRGQAHGSMRFSPSSNEERQPVAAQPDLMILLWPRGHATRCPPLQPHHGAERSPRRRWLATLTLTLGEATDCRQHQSPASGHLREELGGGKGVRFGWVTLVNTITPRPRPPPASIELASSGGAVLVGEDQMDWPRRVGGFDGGIDGGPHVGYVCNGRPLHVCDASSAGRLMLEKSIDNTEG